MDAQAHVQETALEGAGPISSKLIITLGYHGNRFSKIMKYLMSFVLVAPRVMKRRN